MYLCRFCVALTLGLVWYLSDCGRMLIQCFLFFLLCFSSPRLLRNIRRESSTQTDEEAKEKIPQETTKEELFVDQTDSRSSMQAEPLEPWYPHVKKSLQQVFECAYTQLLLPWYRVPEPRQHQPLHQVLSKEFEFVINCIIERGKDFDVCQVVVGSIRILTQHLHNAKQPTRETDPFSSRADEIAVLREFSDTLVRNLFSNSLWEQEVNHCALKEIFAVMGLDLLVTWLSDPDNLNQLVVSQLDSVTSKGSMEDLCGPDQEQSSLAPQQGKGDGSEESLQGAEISTNSKIKGKSKGQKLKDGLSKFMDKMKPKKPKKKKQKTIMEHDPMFRMMGTEECLNRVMFYEDDVSSREGSIHSQQDSDRDSDQEIYLRNQEDMMEFKLSYEMWRIGRWAVSIPHTDWVDEDPIFTVHLAENNSPENLQWDIGKTYNEMVHFRNRWQDSTRLPTILELEDSEVNDEVKESVTVSVQHFLQELVSDNVIGHTQPVFQFFCPLDKLLNEEEDERGVWGLLSGLAYFLTPGQDEEEHSSPQTDTPKEIIIPSPHPESTASPSENSDASTEKGSDVGGASLPAIIISQCDPHSELCPEAETEEKPEPVVNSDSSSNEHSSKDKMVDSENSLASHSKMIKELPQSKSQESLVSMGSSSNEDLDETDSVTHCSFRCFERESTDGPSPLNISAKENKKEKKSFMGIGGVNKAKGKEQGESKPKGEDAQCQKGQGSLDQLEATKAIFDLLKEISGNSILLNIFDAILKPVMPVVKKKVNSFLIKMNPTEEQMAAYINTLREKQWPELQPAAPPPPPPPPRTDEEKNETKERAYNLISAKCLRYHILKKTDVEAVFNLFQKSDENKKFVYRLLSHLLRELFPNDDSLNLRAAALQTVKKSTQ